jgi:predicted dehydrogenase
MNAAPTNVGVIGVGVISAQYFAQLARLPNLRVAAIADLDAGRAAAAAAEQGALALSVDELLTHPDVDVVLNLTIPAAHAEIGLRTLAAGKHLYGEKPLALTTAEARPMLAAADAAGLRIGSAPDTVLGTGIQTARAVLDSGRVGEPIGAAVHWSNPGHETWHPAPAFYYQPGGGPLFDMGPYYLTSLVTLFGPVARVAGTVGRSSRQRTVATGPNAGAAVPVDVDTHVTALLEHASGVTSTVTVSFEIWATRVPMFEVFGTTGTIAVPDPNMFSDPVSVALATGPGARPEFVEVPVAAGYADAGRGVGLSDLARAIETGRPHRASGDLAFHVLEVMESILVAGREHTTVELTSTVPRPDPVPLGAQPWSW